MAHAYCMKCRTMVGMQNPVQVTLKNGRPAARGICRTCGAAIFRMGWP